MAALAGTRRRLFSPDPRRIGRPDSEPFADRVPDSLAGGAPEPVRMKTTS